MTKDQLSRAVSIADSDEDLSHEDLHHFDGFGLKDFNPVFCTMRQLARLVRWQCQYIFGDGFDADALNEIARHGRKRFLVV